MGLPRPLIIAEVHPDLPFMDGHAALDPGFFDAVLDLPGPAPQLFALPREPVADADYAIGLYASTLVRWRLAADRHRRTRSEEHTSELQSLMRISYAVFCLKK